MTEHASDSLIVQMSAECTLGHDEGVTLGGLAPVEEGDALVVLGDDERRRVAADDAAEDAVGVHGISLLPPLHQRRAARCRAGVPLTTRRSPRSAELPPLPSRARVRRSADGVDGNDTSFR